VTVPNIQTSSILYLLGIRLPWCLVAGERYMTIIYTYYTHILCISIIQVYIIYYCDHWSWTCTYKYECLTQTSAGWPFRISIVTLCGRETSGNRIHWVFFMGFVLVFTIKKMFKRIENSSRRDSLYIIQCQGSISN